MSELFKLQNRFQDYLFFLNQSADELVVSTKKISAEVRLAIYGDAYRSRLIEALASNYPVLQKYLNNDVFEKLALDYIEQYPSGFRSIRWFGDQLPVFLTKQPDYKDHHHLVELAQLEWVMTLVFDSADATTLAQTVMATLPPESWITLKFTRHPSIHRLNLYWNVVQIWQEISENKRPHKPLREAEPTYWILWRKNLMEQYCSLTIDEAWAIDAMLNHQTFADICEGLCQWFDPQEASVRAASLLKGWFDAGLISEINV